MTIKITDKTWDSFVEWVFMDSDDDSLEQVRAELARSGIDTSRVKAKVLEALRKRELAAQAPQPVLTIEVVSPGDRSVGIPEGTTVVQLYIKPDDDEHRKAIKEATEALGEAVSGEKSYALFSDQCSTCGSALVNGKCPNKDCLQNMPDEYGEEHANADLDYQSRYDGAVDCDYGGCDDPIPIHITDVEEWLNHIDRIKESVYPSEDGYYRTEL